MDESVREYNELVGKYLAIISPHQKLLFMLSEEIQGQIEKYDKRSGYEIPSAYPIACYFNGRFEQEMTLLSTDGGREYLSSYNDTPITPNPEDVFYSGLTLEYKACLSIFGKTHRDEIKGQVSIMIESPSLFLIGYYWNIDQRYDVYRSCSIPIDTIEAYIEKLVLWGLSFHKKHLLPGLGRTEVVLHGLPASELRRKKILRSSHKHFLLQRNLLLFNRYGWRIPT